jgi:hypothetical protein
VIDPSKQVELEQTQAFIVEYLPPLWKQMYCRLLMEGFEETRAYELLRLYILASTIKVEVKPG